MSNERLHSDSLAYDLPGGPTHPADAMLAEFAKERRRRRIRNLDVEAWVEAQEMASVDLEELIDNE